MKTEEQLKQIQLEMGRRIRAIAREFDVPVYSFFSPIGINESSMKSYLSGRRQLPAVVLLILLETYPMISINYLIKGEGPMFNDKAQKAEPAEIASFNVFEMRKLKLLAALSKQQIKKLLEMAKS